jgi:hypothetical protein
LKKQLLRRKPVVPTAKSMSWPKSVKALHICEGMQCARGGSLLNDNCDIEIAKWFRPVENDDKRFFFAIFFFFLWSLETEKAFQFPLFSSIQSFLTHL